MIRRPSKRGVSLVATSTLLALSLLVPTGVSAALPDLVTSQFAAPATISAGGQGAAVFGIKNNGKSNVSQLYLVDVAISGGTFVKAIPSQGSCTGALCNFGALRAKNSLSVIVVFNATAGAASVNASASFNTTGLGSGGGDNSHGDAWHVAQGVTTSADAQDFAGRFIDANGNLVVQNNQGIGNANPHATKIVAPTTLIGVSVLDSSAVTQPCDATKVACAKLFGQESVISVAQGGTFPGGFQVLISFDGSEVVGANQNSLKIYHTYAGGSEVISTKCAFNPNSTVPKSLPCLTVTKAGQDLFATIWTTHNGVMRGLG